MKNPNRFNIPYSLDLDLAASTPRRAPASFLGMLTTTANASGQMVIQFTNVVNNAKVDAIEVLTL